MGDETIDLAARLGAEGVAELRTLHDKAGRLALMIHDKLALPSFTVGPATVDGVGELSLDDDTSVTVFPLRVIEVIHGVKVEINAPHDNSQRGALVSVLMSRELERVLGPVDRITDETFAVVFEGETFVVEVWDDADEDGAIETIYEGYGVEWVCFCDLINRPAVVTTQGGA